MSKVYQELQKENFSYKFFPFKAKVLKNRIFRFFIVSGINTVFGYVFFALLIFIGLKYSVALFIGTIAGILFNFKTIGALVFKSNNNILIFKFFGVYGITYLGNLAGLALLSLYNIDVYVGGALLLIPMGFLAFVLNKHFVFNGNMN